MADLARIARDLEACLEQSVAAHDVPGAALAVMADGETIEIATGVINRRTGVRATTDALFLIGSISKVYTATLVMSLVDAGKIDLDAHVSMYLPELQLREPGVVDAITVRQLLSHTSGIDEDLDLYRGRGDDCLARFVDAAAELPQVHPPGDLYSYCNTGIIIAGRIVERVTGQTFDEALQERVTRPLGLERTLTLPEQAILHRAAVGHLTGARGEPPRVTPVWTLPRATGPCGGTICATAGEMLAFARMHADGGRGHNGSVVLSRAATAAMHEPQIEMPDTTDADAQGLGWRLVSLGGLSTLMHFGANIGHYCEVWVTPERRFAAAIATNAFHGKPVATDCLEILLGEILGVTVGDREAVPVGDAPTELSAYVGCYANHHDKLDVELHGDALTVTATPRPNWINDLYSAEKASGVLHPIDATRFVVRGDALYGSDEFHVVFIDTDGDGKPDYLHQGGYAYPRTAAGAEWEST